MREPKSERSGLGTTTLVFPCSGKYSGKYTIRSGIEVMIGTGNLCHHRMAKTSSRNPRRVTIINEMIESYAESYTPE